MRETVRAALAAEAPGPVGLAVSGGGDSMALLHLAAGAASGAGTALRAVTVDHGLRPEAAQEAAMVARVCAGLGVAHDVLRWDGWDGRGNLQDLARRARYRLIGEWARAEGIGAVALAHTSDDQAETFLMRLARGSGVDGLSAMPARRQAGGVAWLRPLIGASRAGLRDWLRARGLDWAEDPSNDDPRFDRVKARRALAALEPLGIGADTLSRVAGHLVRARDALGAQTQAAARAVAAVDRGDLLFDAGGLAALHPEIRRRLLRHALIWLSSADYGPRGEALEEFTLAAMAGRAAVLHGCRLLPGKGGFRLTREWRAVRDHAAPAGGLWDGRWRVKGPDAKGLRLRALGEDGLKACKDWRATGLPRAALLASVSVWEGERLVAAPLAGTGAGWEAALADGEDAFFATLLSH